MARHDISDHPKPPQHRVGRGCARRDGDREGALTSLMSR
jgi:hypothetical protein